MADNPFEVLGLAPTLEPAEVKRAYFAALARHPPHLDPEGFRRIRAAYERLMRPEGLAAAWLEVPVEVAAELQRYRALLDGPLAGAAEAHRQRTWRLQAREQFAQRLSRLSWTEVLARFQG